MSCCSAKSPDFCCLWVDWFLMSVCVHVAEADKGDLHYTKSTEDVEMLQQQLEDIRDQVRSATVCAYTLFFPLSLFVMCSHQYNSPVCVSVSDPVPRLHGPSEEPGLPLWSWHLPDVRRSHERMPDLPQEHRATHCSLLTTHFHGEWPFWGLFGGALRPSFWACIVCSSCLLLYATVEQAINIRKRGIWAWMSSIFFLGPRLPTVVFFFWFHSTQWVGCSYFMNKSCFCFTKFAAAPSLNVAS